MSRYRIALSELETGDADLFRAALARLLGRLTQHWEWSDLAHADLVIVDMDSLFGHMAWLKAHATGKQVITHARSGKVHGSDLVLGKPFDDDAFAAVLEQAGRVLDQLAPAAVAEDAAPIAPAPKPAATAAEHATARVRAPQPVELEHDMAAAAEVAVAEPPAPEPAPAAFVPPPEPEPRTIAELLARKPPTGPVQVGELLIDPEHGAYFTVEASLKPLRALLEREASALLPANIVQVNKARAGKAHPLLRLRWFAGLIATPGKLAHGLRHEERCKLARWPQTEREFPRHFRIATAMMKEAATPAGIAATSGAPLPDVIDYINASRAAGWLAIERDEPPLVEEEPPQRGALLSRFRKPFAR